LNFHQRTKFDKGSNIFPLLLHLEFKTVYNVKKSKKQEKYKMLKVQKTKQKISYMYMHCALPNII